MFLYSLWLELPFVTRIQLADAFGIPKKGATEVFSNSIIKDGYDIKDIEAKLSMEAMQDFLGLVDGGDDMNELFKLVVEKVTYVPPAPVVAQEVVVKTTVTETVTRPVEHALSQSPVEDLEKEIVKETSESHAETKKSTKK